MRFVLTVVDPNRGVSADVVVDAEPGLTVAGFLPSLVEAVGRPVAVPGSARVINLHGPGASADQLPTIFVDGQPVDPRLSLAESPLREGTLLSIGDSLAACRRNHTGWSSSASSVGRAQGPCTDWGWAVTRWAAPPMPASGSPARGSPSWSRPSA
jgi:hypothetical protein